MLYYIFRPIIHLAFKVYFRKIYLSNKDRIPKEGAVIFAYNHPTAFLDPMLMAVFQMRIVHFMLRGDLFDKKMVIRVLNSFKTIPIFRFRDGFESLRKNEATFERCYKMLADGKHIVIMAEGQTWHEKKLHPIQKGTARMAVGSYEKFGNDKITILPVGINYTDSVAFRSEIMVDFGEPILLGNYLDDLKDNSRRAIKKITDEISRQLREKVVHINLDEDAPYVNTLLDMRRNDRGDSSFPVVSASEIPMKDEVKISRKVNELPEDKKTKIFKAISDYQTLIETNNIADAAVKLNTGILSADFFKSILLGLPALLGFVIYCIPFYIAKYIADKNVTARMEFYSSVRLAALAILVSLFSLFVIVLLHIVAVLKWYQSILLLPFLGMSAVFFEEYFRKWRNQLRFMRLKDPVKKEMLAKREELMKFMR